MKYIDLTVVPDRVIACSFNVETIIEDQAAIISESKGSEKIIIPNKI